jgi:hypothetical protein
VSVLFCDLVGFTAASEQQGPEDVRARIRPYHARLRSEIESYGGPRRPVWRSLVHLARRDEPLARNS